MKFLPTYISTYLYIYIYIYKVSWPSVVKVDSLFNSYNKKVLESALFSSLDCSIYLDTYLLMLSVSQAGIRYHIWVFAMTQPRIEPRSSGPLGKFSTHCANGQVLALTYIFYVCREWNTNIDSNRFRYHKTFTSPKG